MDLIQWLIWVSLPIGFRGEKGELHFIYSSIPIFNVFSSLSICVPLIFPPVFVYFSSFPLISRSQHTVLRLAFALINNFAQYTFKKCDITSNTSGPFLIITFMQQINAPVCWTVHWLWFQLNSKCSCNILSRHSALLLFVSVLFLFLPLTCMCPSQTLHSLSPVIWSFSHADSLQMPSNNSIRKQIETLQVSYLVSVNPPGARHL